jgi:hypothetical protein
MEFGDVVMGIKGVSDPFFAFSARVSFDFAAESFPKATT